MAVTNPHRELLAKARSFTGHAISREPVHRHRRANRPLGPPPPLRFRRASAALSPTARRCAAADAPAFRPRHPLLPRATPHSWKLPPVSSLRYGPPTSTEYPSRRPYGYSHPPDAPPLARGVRGN